jgi:hypothetical protein
VHVKDDMKLIKGKQTRSLSNPIYRRILDTAPDYASVLLANEWLRLEVHDHGPAIAWTQYDRETNRFVVNFHEEAYNLSDKALQVLWRHEIGHISLGHFNKELCIPEDVYRSHSERMMIGDIQINYFIDDKESMSEVGRMAVDEIAPKEMRKDAEPEGYIDPDIWLPKIGLAVSEYPYEIIHAHFHEWMDEQIEEHKQNCEQCQAGGGGEGEGEGGEGHGIPESGMCGGIEEVGDDDTGMAEAVASVIAGVAGDETMGGEQWGKGDSRGTILLKQTELPAWLPALERFARSIVEVVLAEKRTHARPQPAYEGFGIHVPTRKPRWDYQPSQIVFCVDTSGSMIDDLKYVAPVIQYLADHKIETRLIAGDVRVTFDDVVTAIPTGLVGGGGTDIVPILKRAYDYEPESVIIFTDGYVPSWGKDPGVPVLWVGTRESPPYGEGIGVDGQPVKS